MMHPQSLPEITTELINQVQNLQSLAKELSLLIGEFGMDEQDIHIAKDMYVDTPVKIIPFRQSASHETETDPSCAPLFRAGEKTRRIIDSRLPSGCLLAIPGKPFPDGIIDYRGVLQRDGLILLSWDKRITEMGERYTAYWVTSVGIPRFYASRSLSPQDFPSARPDHKSYAAEDGIEFYGQHAPIYMVHIAPDLMMSHPQHGELRAAHIQALQEQGSTVDFDYIYLLKTEKEKNRQR